MLNKIGKSMPTLLPKSRNMRPKIDLESPLGSNFSILEAFGAMQKYDEFLMRFLSLKKSENWPKERPRDVFPAPRVRRVYSSWRPGPQGGHARDQKLGIRNKKLSFFEKETGYLKGSNTPKGQRPGEFCFVPTG